jgi:lipid-A-disaccharide synthase
LAQPVLLNQHFPGIQFVLPLASTLTDNDLAPWLKDCDLPITVTRERIHDLMRACDAVISVSGTVTLEVALVGTPLVIIYKLSPITFQLAKRLVKVEHIGLCNIVAGETVAKELIQDDASPEQIAAEIGRLLSDAPYNREIKKQLSYVRERLGRWRC